MLRPAPLRARPEALCVSRQSSKVVAISFQDPGRPGFCRARRHGATRLLVSMRAYRRRRRHPTASDYWFRSPAAWPAHSGDRVSGRRSRLQPSYCLTRRLGAGVLRRLTPSVAAIALGVASLCMSGPWGWVAINMKDPDRVAFLPVGARVRGQDACHAESLTRPRARNVDFLFGTSRTMGRTSRRDGWHFREDRRECVGELAARRLVADQAVWSDRVARYRDAYATRVQDRGSHVAEDDPQRCVSTLARPAPATLIHVAGLP